MLEARYNYQRRQIHVESYCYQYLRPGSGEGIEILYRNAGVCKKHDIPVGEHRWIALVSPEDQDGTELLLEPNVHPAATEYQKKIFAEGIPATMFGVADLHEEYNRLINHGVKFTMEPTVMGDVTLAVFDDTCGNLIQIAQK